MLADYYRQYQSFNIENLDKEIRDELARQIDEISDDFFNHKDQVQGLLE